MCGSLSWRVSVLELGPCPSFRGSGLITLSFLSYERDEQKFRRGGRAATIFVINHILRLSHWLASSNGGARPADTRRILYRVCVMESLDL